MKNIQCKENFYYYDYVIKNKKVVLRDLTHPITKIRFNETCTECDKSCPMTCKYKTNV